MIHIERIPGVLASAYEKSARMAIESYYTSVAQEVVGHLPAGIILDLGTGPGYLPIEIARRSPDVRIVGIDLSRRLIAAARATAAEAGLSRQLQFQRGDASRTGFKDSSFDLVISTGMLHSLKNPVKVILEVHRVLKAGGQAWIFDPAVIGSGVDRKAWKASLNLRERIFFNLFRWLGLHKPAETMSPNEVAALVSKTDFKDYRLDTRGKEIRLKLTKA